MPDETMDPIDRSLQRADRGELGGTMQEQRREMQRPGIPRPDQGPSMMARLLTRFRGRSDDRDSSRSDSRR